MFEDDELEDSLLEEEDVSPEELHEYMDTNPKDGKVTKQEAWHAIATELDEVDEDGKPLTPEPPPEIAKVISDADANGNSFIDLEEIPSFVEKLTEVVDDFEDDDELFDEDDFEDEVEA